METTKYKELSFTGTSNLVTSRILKYKVLIPSASVQNSVWRKRTC